MPQSAHYIKEQLQKATDKDGNVRDMKGVLENFSKLEKMKITKDELEITRLGLMVNNIRKAAKTPEISSRAKKLIKTWQKMLHPDQGKPSSRPSTPQAIKKQVVKNNDSLTNAARNEVTRLIHKQKNESSSPSPNGLKLTLKLPVGNKTLPDKPHIVNISQEHGNKKKIKTDYNGKEKGSKKKHKKSKKSHKSPHKRDQLAVKVQAAIKVKENLDKKNNNSPSLQHKNVINTVINNSNFSLDVAPHKLTNGEIHKTLNKSLKRKYDDTPGPEEMCSGNVNSNAVPIKKIKNKPNNDETINQINKVSPGRQKLKERGLSYDPSTGTLLSVPLPSSRNKPVDSSPTIQQSPIALIKTEINEASTRKEFLVTEEIEINNLSLKDTDSDKHYPTMLSPCVKIINDDISDSNPSDLSSKLNLPCVCSEQKKKKVKQKTYPFKEKESSESILERNITIQLANSVQSASSSTIKSDVNCSLKHEWPGVSGCKGNNKNWYNWDEEIFIKPSSDKHLNENDQIETSIPLHILPYVELE